MSLYNMLHGMNLMADQLLACLGLSRGEVGRFRDVYVAEGKIAVYTRNGGGNRICWCEDNPEFGYSHCKGEDWQREENEMVEMTAAEIAAHPEVKPLNIFIGDKRVVETGKRVIETHHRCDNPNSADCACPGCTIEYRLPKHPNYLYDEDDDFDSTYATVYFSFPEQYKDWLALCESGKWEPDRKWLEFFQRMETNALTETERAACQKTVEGLKKLLNGDEN